MMVSVKDSIHVIIGASSGIASEFIGEISNTNPDDIIVCLSQSKLLFDFHNVVCLQIQYTEEHIENSVNEVKERFLTSTCRIKSITFFNGQLHNSSFSPEKSIRNFNSDYANHLFNTNVVAPMLCLKYLVKLINRKDECVITGLSARVGSIEDNGLGGWYTYRSTKSALNMMMKNLAIELKRQSPNSTVILFHPGTTDTQLSKPFQKNVPEGKLFEPKFVANCLLTQIFKANKQDLINYIDWQGQSIKW